MKRRSMRRKLVSLILAGILPLCLCACGKKDTLKETEVMLGDDSAEDMADDTLKESLTLEEKAASLTVEKEFEEVYADFSVNLFRLVAEPDTNVMISPLSILTALSMTENGAKGETLRQMEQVLAGGASLEWQNGELTAYIESLPDGKEAHLNQANAIWFGAEGGSFIVNEDFLQKNADAYGAEVHEAVFNEDTLREINGWVSKETEGMIPWILEEVSQDAVMYLINAIAFEAEWEEIYVETQVREGNFQERQNIAFMYSEEYGYFEDEDTKGFWKPYKQGYSFAAFLPQETIAMEDYLAEFTGEKYLKLIDSMDKTAKVKAGIPKFTSDYAVELQDVLKNMGMVLAFDPAGADFSGMGSLQSGNIYISRVLHKTYISVEERGTKAGAATVVDKRDGCAAAEGEIREVILNRPFVYAIVDNERKLPVFLGVVMDPVSSAASGNIAGEAPDEQHMIMVDGKLYCDTGEVINDPGCGMMDGCITDIVEADKIPAQDNQANFGEIGMGYQRTGDINSLDVYFDNQWIRFGVVE